MTDTAYDQNNIFAKILKKEIPCDAVYEDEYVLGFKDIAPQAPIHILVIPKGEYVSMTDFSATAGQDEITALHRAVATIIEQYDLGENGYRVIANTGDHGGQEVPHLHLHILAGEKIGPMRSK